MSRVKEERRTDVARLVVSVQSKEQQNLELVVDLVKRLSDQSVERKRVYEEYAIERDLGFNFFTSISDFHRRETFHSDVLALIFNPNTDVIGHAAKECLHRFFRAIEECSEGLLQINVEIGSRTRVEKEIGNAALGRIDLLIHDGTRAVIVENKINDAVDQPDQLARYLRYCQIRPEGALAVDAIVYLPRVWKTPPHLYSNAYRDLVDEVKRLTVVLPAVGKRATERSSPQIDLSHDVLGKCVSNLENRTMTTASVYVEQYADLVKQIGGNAVAEEIDKSILRELFSTEESIRTTRDISEVWDQRNTLIPKIVFDMLTRKEGMKSYPDNPDVLVYEDLPGADGRGYAIAFERDGSIGFHFSSENALSDPQIDELKEAMESIEFGPGFGPIQNNVWWVWRGIDGVAITEPIDAFVDRVHRILGKLQSAMRKRRPNT
jgi:hypothetical protein